MQAAPPQLLKARTMNRHTPAKGLWALRLAAWMVGLLLLVGALRSPDLYDPEGYLRGSFVLPLAGTFALLLLGWAVGRPILSAASYAALALVGQAAALQLIEAGPYVRYQHYIPYPRLLADPNVLVWVLLGIQTAFVAGGVVRLWPTIRQWLGSMRPWQLAFVGLGFFLTSATLAWPPSVYIVELCLATFVQAVNLLNLLLVAAALPESALARFRMWTDRLLSRNPSEATRRSKGLDRFAVLAAVCVTTVTAALSYGVYERHPHLQDEGVYLYHARYLAAGMLTMPTPPVLEAFDLDLMHEDNGRWYCPFAPGWPAVLAIGVLLGVPWLVNPVLAGVNVLLAYLLLRQLYDLATSRVTLLLLCVSPWNLFLGMSFMTHTLTLTCALAAAYAVARLRMTAWLPWGLLGGAAVGAISLIRPLEGLAVAMLLGLWVCVPSGVGKRLPSLAALVAGTVLVAGLVLPYNYVLTGSATTMPFQVYSDKVFGPGTNSLGFGPNRGFDWRGLDPLPGHGLFDVLINANFNLFATNVELFGWATGSLFLITLVMVSRSRCAADWLMLAVIAVIIGIHSFYWFAGGPDFGARYWYLTVVPGVALTARGAWILGEWLEGGGRRVPGGRMRVLAAMAVLCLAASVTFVPWRMLDKYHHYLGMRPDIRYLAAQHDFGRSLVLIRGKKFPDFASAGVYNPLDLQSDGPLYAWDRSPETQSRLLRVYADRPVWIVNGPSVTGSGYQVVAGPLPASRLTDSETLADHAYLDRAP